MEEIIINGKALYTPKGAAREYAAVGCNFYTGCPHNCEYCYLKRGAPSKQLGGKEVKLKKCFKSEVHAREILEKELDANLEHLQKVGIFLSFTTDPLIKETRNLTGNAILSCVERNIPVMVLTKDADFITDGDFMSCLKMIADKNRIAFGFTLTGRDDMEPNASSNDMRIIAMRELHNLGFKTWASIEPIVDFSNSLKVIQKSIDCCNHYKVGLMSGVKKDYYHGIDLVNFMWSLIDIKKTHNIKMYIKESIRKYLGDSYLVTYFDDGRNFNLFEG